MLAKRSKKGKLRAQFVEENRAAAGPQAGYIEGCGRTLGAKKKKYGTSALGDPIQRNERSMGKVAPASARKWKRERSKPSRKWRVGRRRWGPIGSSKN